MVENAIRVIGIHDNHNPSSDNIKPINENENNTSIRNNNNDNITVAIAMGSIFFFLSYDLFV